MKIYLKHRYRPPHNYCDECGVQLIWKYIDGSWIPCDTTPMLFYPGMGKYRVVYRGELLTDALLYRSGLNLKQHPLQGLSPHVFTCLK